MVKQNINDHINSGSLQNKWYINKIFSFSSSITILLSHLGHVEIANAVINLLNVYISTSLKLYNVFFKFLIFTLFIMKVVYEYEMLHIINLL